MSRAIIYSAPLVGLVDELREESRSLEQRGIRDLAGALSDAADRLAARIEEANRVQHLTTQDVADLRGTTLEAVAALCRRRWSREGRARKVAGQWVIDPEAVRGYAA